MRTLKICLVDYYNEFLDLFSHLDSTKYAIEVALADEFTEPPPVDTKFLALLVFYYIVESALNCDGNLSSQQFVDTFYCSSDLDKLTPQSRNEFERSYAPIDPIDTCYEIYAETINELVAESPYCHLIESISRYVDTIMVNTVGSYLSDPDEVTIDLRTMSINVDVAPRKTGNVIHLPPSRTIS